MFQATGVQNFHAVDGDVVIFPNVDYNHGSGYNVTTGKFTAPVSGLYAFVKQICVYNGKFAFTQFVRNDKNILASEVAAPTFQHSCASSQVFQYLSKNDQVWVKSTHENYFNDFTQARDMAFAGVFIHMWRE